MFRNVFPSSRLTQLHCFPILSMLNPFTAGHHVAWKRPIKMRNLKSLGLFSSSVSMWKDFFLSKRTVLKVDLLQNWKIYRLQACVCTLFGPELLQAVALNGLNGVCHIGESDSSLVIKFIFQLLFWLKRGARRELLPSSTGWVPLGGRQKPVPE